MDPQGLLGGSWVVISGVISRVTIIITPSRGFVAPVITAHEPPSTGVQLQRLSEDSPRWWLGTFSRRHGDQGQGGQQFRV